MSFVQRSTILIFSLFFSTAFSLTSVERNLKRTYKNIGFSCKEAGLFCGQITGLCKQLIDCRALKCDGVSSESLSSIMVAGVLIRPSDTGIAEIRREATVFAQRANDRKFPLSKKHARILREEAVRFVFRWIADELNKYEKTSLYHTYVMQSSNTDFVGHVVMLDWVTEELRALGLTAS